MERINAESSGRKTYYNGNGERREADGKREQQKGKSKMTNHKKMADVEEKHSVKRHRSNRQETCIRIPCEELKNDSLYI